MSEYTDAVGVRVELRQKKQTLEAEIDSYQESLRSLLSPAKDYDELERTQERIVSLAVALAENLIQRQEIGARLEKLAAVLGR